MNSVCTACRTQRMREKDALHFVSGVSRSHQGVATVPWDERHIKGCMTPCMTMTVVRKILVATPNVVKTLHLNTCCLSLCMWYKDQKAAIASQPFCKWPRHEHRSVLISQAG